MRVWATAGRDCEPGVAGYLHRRRESLEHNGLLAIRAHAGDPQPGSGEPREALLGCEPREALLRRQPR